MAIPRDRGRTTRGLSFAGCVLSAALLHAQQPVGTLQDTRPRTVTETSLEEYLKRVNANQENERSTPGSVWTERARFANLAADTRAVQVHDLISVVVSESIAASTDDTVNNTRKSNANTQVSSLIGALHGGNALQNLVNQNSASGLTATGQSATNTSLSTVFGGQVVAVLPNGILVIEAARQVEFSQQKQTIVLRGLVRPEDISQQNQILSTAISDMELMVKGSGINTDFTHRQTPLVRLLQRLLVF
ncbi:MAG: flagellar basal body L-ring protein FlgH [Acidobacteriota bacterium]|nr:flagellar basal body L-ring protein FlgH [Acidobacteriota bacterium]